MLTDSSGRRVAYEGLSMVATLFLIQDLSAQNTDVMIIDESKFWQDITFWQNFGRIGNFSKMWTE